MVNKLKSKEILTYLFLIVIGYFIAKMFSRVCMNRVNRFSVGCQSPGGDLHKTIEERSKNTYIIRGPVELLNSK